MVSRLIPGPSSAQVSSQMKPPTRLHNTYHWLWRKKIPITILWNHCWYREVAARDSKPKSFKTYIGRVPSSVIFAPMTESLWFLKLLYLTEIPIVVVRIEQSVSSSSFADPPTSQTLVTLHQTMPHRIVQRLISICRYRWTYLQRTWLLSIEIWCKKDTIKAESKPVNPVKQNKHTSITINWNHHIQHRSGPPKASD